MADEADDSSLCSSGEGVVLAVDNLTRQNDAHQDDPDCVCLTEDQYRCIAELGKDPQYVGPMAITLSYPPWQSFSEGKSKSFDWIVYSSYLGLLHLGLQAKGVEGGRELYRNVISIWERQFRNEMEPNPRTRCYFTRYPHVPTPLHMTLRFTHVGGQWFRMKLIPTSHTRTKNLKPEARKEFQRLVSEAFLLNRSRIADRRMKGLCSHSTPFMESIKRLPGNEQIDDDKALKKTEGYLSVGFNEELKRTIAHIGMLMESEEEEQEEQEVDWELVRGDMKSALRQHTDLFKIIGEALDEHIEDFGYSLLALEEAGPSGKRKGKRKNTSHSPKPNTGKRKSKRPKLHIVELTPEFIEDSDSSS